MTRADELRAQLAVVELEEQLTAAKGDGAVESDLKHQLRYARWVARGGPDTDPADDNRATAELRAQWANGQEG